MTVFGCAYLDEPLGRRRRDNRYRWTAVFNTGQVATLEHEWFLGDAEGILNNLRQMFLRSLPGPNYPVWAEGDRQLLVVHDPRREDDATVYLSAVLLNRPANQIVYRFSVAGGNDAFRRYFGRDIELTLAANHVRRHLATLHTQLALQGTNRMGNDAWERVRVLLPSPSDELPEGEMDQGYAAGIEQARREVARSGVVVPPWDRNNDVICEVLHEFSNAPPPASLSMRDMLDAQRAMREAMMFDRTAADAAMRRALGIAGTPVRADPVRVGTPPAMGSVRPAEAAITPAQRAVASLTDEQRETMRAWLREFADSLGITELEASKAFKARPNFNDWTIEVYTNDDKIACRGTMRRPDVPDERAELDMGPARHVAPEEDSAPRPIEMD